MKRNETGDDLEITEWSKRLIIDFSAATTAPGHSSVMTLSSVTYGVEWQRTQHAIVHPLCVCGWAWHIDMIHADARVRVHRFIHTKIHTQIHY